MDFYKRERTYRGEGESHLVHEVTPQKITLRKEYHPLFFATHTNGVHETPFKEISIVPFDGANEFISEDIKKGDLILKDFVNLIYDKLTEIVEKTWAKDKFHAVMHSSGYDSRLLSMIIKRLHEKNGDEWLGRFLFIEADGEGPEARACLRLEGWENKRMLVFNEGAEPSEYHAYNLDFKDAWRRVNVFSGWPVNCWYFPIEYYQKKGVLPEDVQCYTGYGQNETTAAILTDGYRPYLPPLQKLINKYEGKQRIGYYFWWHYYHTLASFPLKGEWVHPFYNFDYLRLFIKYGRKFEGEIWKEQRVLQQSLTRFMLDYLNPIHHKVKKLVTSHVRSRGYRTLSRELFEQVKSDYFNSWYGKLHPEIIPTNQIIYCEWWGHWALASYCEYLLETGHEIEVEN